MVKIPVNLPIGSGRKAFLDHFNAQLSRRMNSSSGTAQRRLDGTFESRLSGAVAFDGGEIELNLRYEESLDGHLYIEAERGGDEPSTVDWEQQIQGIVLDSLAAALTVRTQSFFRRAYRYYIGPQLDGEYWFGKIRFAPALPEDDQPSALNAERVVVFDQMIEAIDHLGASLIGDEIVARIAARFSLLLDTALYPARSELRWVSIEGGASTRHHLGFTGRHVAPQAMPRKADLCRLGQWNGELLPPYHEAGKLLSFPRQSRLLLRSIDHASAPITVAFDNCARLYQVGLDVGRYYPSVRLAYHVSAVEVLSGVDSAGNFSDFMRKYCGLSRDELDPYLQFLYGSVRSSHFHAGIFPIGEYDCIDFPQAFMSSEYIDRSHRLRTATALIYAAIRNWLLAQLPSEAS